MEVTKLKSHINLKYFRRETRLTSLFLFLRIREYREKGVYTNEF